MGELTKHYIQVSHQLESHPELVVRGRLIGAESVAGPAVCALGHLIVANEIANISPSSYVVSSITEHDIEPMKSLGAMTQFEAESKLARDYGVPVWEPIALRVAFDFRLDVAEDDPLVAFHPASNSLGAFFNYLWDRSPKQWESIRNVAAEEFVDAVRLASNESSAMSFALSKYKPAQISAAQVIAKDIGRIQAWSAVAGQREASSLEWDVAWAGSAGDLSRRAAIETMALSAGARDVEDQALRLLGTSFKEL